ncbi:ATP-binding protein [Adlercreutzia sp. ZJ141]|uniref:ATP-binding protein n=1 Tax=Adlercreutzia sp. ZJ141 TaxID=2709406 RepID=UPI0013EAE46E|nr:ATP-binding protein [Adlercreutzia sp. ZJ141]
MFQRKAYNQLERWADRLGQTALLVTGARQIGKSYLIEHLGRQRFQSLAEVNLVLNKDAKRVLSDVSSVEDFIVRLSLLSDAELIVGKTLVFIDEIQELPDLMTLVKALVQDGRFCYAFSGSMLGTELRHVRSYPVGFVTEVTMYPMDFEEFCWANALKPDVLGVVDKCCAALTPVPDYLHESLLSYFRTYMVVGGMPAAVQAFVDDGGNMRSVRTVQSELVVSYVHDITKYAKNAAPNVCAIFEQLPVQLDAKSQRFRLNSLDSKARYDKFSLDFNWLVSAHVGLKCNVVRNPKSPLKATEDSGNFKLYESDTGMLTSRYDISVARALYTDDRTVNLGFMFENVFAQALVSCGCSLYYYMNRKRGEVDFLVEGARGEVVPIEIKSGRSPRAHEALNKLLATSDYDIKRGFVFSRLNVEVRDKVVYLPWYAALCLPEALGLRKGVDTEDSFTITLPKLG